MWEIVATLLFALSNGNTHFSMQVLQIFKADDSFLDSRGILLKKACMHLDFSKPCLAGLRDCEM